MPVGRLVLLGVLHRAGRRTGWRTGRRRATPRTRPRQSPQRRQASGVAEFFVRITRVEPTPDLALADGGATGVAAGAPRQPTVLDGGGDAVVLCRAHPGHGRARARVAADPASRAAVDPRSRRPHQPQQQQRQRPPTPSTSSKPNRRYRPRAGCNGLGRRRMRPAPRSVAGPGWCVTPAARAPTGGTAAPAGPSSPAAGCPRASHRRPAGGRSRSRRRRRCRRGPRPCWPRGVDRHRLDAQLGGGRTDGQQFDPAGVGSCAAGGWRSCVLTGANGARLGQRLVEAQGQAEAAAPIRAPGG